MNLRPADSVPLLVERVQQVDSSTNGQTYEEANWAKLSPVFRETHNRLRQARGLEPIPPPKRDLYVKPQAPRIVRIDYNDKELIASIRQFTRPQVPLPGDEGFHINGTINRPEPQPKQQEPDEGFRVDGFRAKF